MATPTESLSEELLFFDTFSHCASEESGNMDLVQFPQPVEVSEVRVIPLGCRVQADFPGGHPRLGATNPSAFQLELFVNDLSRRNSSTFVQLGELGFTQDEIRFVPRRVPTDGLLIKGGYTTITLAVYGNLTRLEQENTPPPQPQQVHQPQPQQPHVPSGQQEPPPIVAHKTEHTVGHTHGHHLKPQQTQAEHKHTPVEVPLEWKSETEPQQDVRQTHAHYKDSETRHLKEVKEQSTHTASVIKEYRSATSSPRDDKRILQSTGVVKEEPFSKEQHSNDEERCTPPGSGAAGKKRKRPRTPPIPCEIPAEAATSPPVPPNRLLKDEIDARSDGGGGGDSRRERSRREDRHREGKDFRETREHDRHESRHSKRRRSGSSGDRDRSSGREETRTESSRTDSTRDAGRSREGREQQRDRDRTKGDRDRDSRDGKETRERTEHRDKERGDKDRSEKDRSREDARRERQRDARNADGVSRERATERKRSESSESKDEFSDDLEEISSDDEPFDPASAPVEDSPSARGSGPSQDVLEFIVDLKQQLDEEVGSASFLREGRHLPPGLDVNRLHDLVQRTEAEIGPNRGGERFVLAMEDVASLFGPNSNLDSVPTVVRLTLIEWCRDGLDFDVALEQTQPAFKVRHLKAGLRLVAAMMSACDEDAMAELLREDVAGGHFLRLYLKPHMYLPLKLQLVRCLDMLSRFQCGLRYLMYHRFTLTFANSVEEEYTCYQALVKVLLENPSSRLSVALSSLLSKLHLCDLCATLKNVAVDLMNSEPDMEPSLDEATSILKQIFDTHLEAGTTMGQYPRSVPAKAKFDLPTSVVDPYTSLYAMYRYNDLLVTCCVLAARSKAFRSTLESFLDEIMSTMPGCLYLLEKPILVPLLERLVPDVSATLRSLALISTVFEQTTKEVTEDFREDLDQNEILIGALHRLASLTLEKANPRRLEGLVKALILENNIDCVLQFVQRRNGEPILKTTVCSGYAVILIKAVVQLGTNVDFYEKYLGKLVELSETSSRLDSLSPWLEPLTKLQFPLDHTCVAPLVAGIKAYIQENALLCPQMIASVRTLRGISAPGDILRPDEPFLKHRYNLAELFSQDGLSVLSQLIEKLCEHYAAPLAVKLELSSKAKVLRVLQVLTPTVEMVSQMLKMVICCRGAAFKDLTPIPVLLNTYQLFWMLGEERLSYITVTTLLAYTQPIQDGTETEQTLNKSLWTMMLKKVLANLRSGPKAFGVTLQVLCELLPLPLPMKVDRPLENEEDAKILITNRKLWSVHLDQCRSELLELYQTLSSSTDLNVTRMLELFTIQVCDLSAPSCQMILDILSETIATFPKEGIDQRYLQGPLNLLSNLCENHLPASVGVLLLYGNPESETNPLASAIKLLNESEQDVPVLSSIHLVRSVLLKAHKYSTKEVTSGLINALLGHAASERSKPSTILEVFRCLISVKTEAVSHVGDILEECLPLLYQAADQLSSKFAADSEDSLSCLLSLVELIKKLEENSLRGFMSQKPADSDSDKMHPLAALKDKLKQESIEGLESTYNELQALIDDHQDLPPSEMETTAPRPDTPAPESAPVQKSLGEVFEAERVVYIVDDIPDVDLDASRLLRVTADLDEYQRECSLQQDTLLIETDLVAISETCTMSELSLRAELEKMLARTIKQEPLSALPKHHRSAGHGSGSGEEAKKQQPFVAPMRANVAPIMMARQSRVNDPFRSRPPNTSRPPSMHVDDFVAMESSGSSRNSMLLHRTSERPRPMERSRGPPRGMNWQATGPTQRYF